MSTEQQEKKDLTLYQKYTSPSTWGWMEWTVVICIVLIIAAAVYMATKKPSVGHTEVLDLANKIPSTPSSQGNVSSTLKKLFRTY